MVAITVVLAATVFVLVSELGKQSTGTAPGFEIMQDEPNDRLTVTTRTTGADWVRIEVRADKGWHYELNGVQSPALTANIWSQVATSTQPIQAGDNFDVCLSSGPVTSLSVEIRDLRVQFLLHQVTLDSVDTIC